MVSVIYIIMRVDIGKRKYTYFLKKIIKLRNG